MKYNCKLIGDLQAHNKWQGIVTRSQYQVFATERMGGVVVSPTIQHLYSNHAFKIQDNR